MEISLLKRIGKIAIRSIVLYATFGIVTIISRFIFNSNLFDEEMISPKTLGAWHVIFLLLIFESTVFTLNRYSTKRKKYIEKYAHSGFLGRAQSIFLSVDLYVEYAIVAIVSLILPLNWLFDCIGMAMLSEGYSKSQVLFIALPSMLVLELIAHFSVRYMWLSDSLKRTNEKEKSELSCTIKSGVSAALVYIGASLIIPWVLPFFVTLSNFGNGINVLWISVPILLISVISVLATYYVRAVSKRGKFIKELKKTCSTHSIKITDIQKPYLSVFFAQKGIDFTIKCNENRYDCKLVAGVFPNSPIVFSDTGEGIRQNTLRLFKVDLLHLNTIIDYKFDSTGNKIIIVLPVPKRIYVSVNGSSPRPADTGENVGNYTLYTATGFINALERGLLK